jgi:hypothetical protein
MTAKVFMLDCSTIPPLGCATFAEVRYEDSQASAKKEASG